MACGAGDSAVLCRLLATSIDSGESPLRAQVASRTGLALLVLVAAAASARADDEVLLDVTLGPDPGEIRLDWTGGGPGFQVYRSDEARRIVAPANQLGSTQSATWLDIPPAGDLFYYRVMGPCLTPSAELCDGVDDDCDSVVDN